MLLAASFSTFACDCTINNKCQGRQLVVLHRYKHAPTDIQTQFQRIKSSRSLPSGRTAVYLYLSNFLDPWPWPHSCEISCTVKSLSKGKCSSKFMPNLHAFEGTQPFQIDNISSIPLSLGSLDRRQTGLFDLITRHTCIQTFHIFQCWTMA